MEAGINMELVMKIYSQTDSYGFYIGTQADEGVAGAIDTPLPEFNPSTHRARWVDNGWDIRTHAEWDNVLNPPIKEVPFIPRQVTRAQGKAALIQAGIWPSVLSFIDTIEDETEKALALVAINDTTHWQRSSPFLNQAAWALGVSQEQLDDLFLEASKIEL